MRYYKFILVKALQSYNPSKLEIMKNIAKILQLTFSTQLYIVNRCSSSDPGSIPGGRKLCGSTVLQPLDLQG